MNNENLDDTNFANINLSNALNSAILGTSEAVIKIGTSNNNSIFGFANPEASPEEVYQALEQKALDLEYPAASNQSGVEFDEGTGFGLIQADFALENFVGDTDVI